MSLLANYPLRMPHQVRCVVHSLSYLFLALSQTEYDRLTELHNAKLLRLSNANANYGKTVLAQIERRKLLTTTPRHQEDFDKEFFDRGAKAVHVLANGLHEIII
jgi:hypothetical protein